jgi:hypothetical protein
MSKEHNEKWYNTLLNLLVKWGCNETVAKVVAGAIIGALLAVGVLTSCDNISASQLYTIHSMYHKITDEECIFTVDEKTK